MNKSTHPLLKLSQTFNSTVVIVQIYYFILLGLMFSYLLPNGFSIPAELNPNLMWPIAFFDGLSFKISFITCILGVITFAGLSGLFPKTQSFRLLTFILLLFTDSFQNSSGAKTHIYQFWLWSSCFMALIPGTLFPWRSLTESRSYKLQFLTGFWGASSIVLIFYFLSGSWKFFGMVQQLFYGEPNLLSQDGILYHIASEKIRAGTNSLAFNFLNEHRIFNPLLGAGVIVVQLSTIIGIFKGRFLPLIGISLVLFHIGTYFILSITYPPNVFLVGIIFCSSPLKHNVGFSRLINRHKLIYARNRIIGVNFKLNRK